MPFLSHCCGQSYRKGLPPKEEEVSAVSSSEEQQVPAGWGGTDGRHVPWAQGLVQGSCSSKCSVEISAHTRERNTDSTGELGSFTRMDGHNSEQAFPNESPRTNARCLLIPYTDALRLCEWPSRSVVNSAKVPFAMRINTN